jgi:hypothetical protein
MADSPFSLENTKRAIDTLPPEQGEIGVVVQRDDVGVQGAVSKSIGKGWSVAATGSWFKEKGYQAAAWLGWKGTP